MEHTERTIVLCLLLTTVVTITIWFLTGPITTFLALLSSSISLAVLAVHSLSLLATENVDQTSNSKRPLGKGDSHGHYGSRSLVWTTRLTGIISAIYFLGIPFYIPGGPLNEAGARAIGFACACKILDLTVARAHKPPKMMEGKQPISVTDQNRGKYVWLLLRECRYHSFDIAIVEKERDGPANSRWTYGPGIVLPLLAYFVPCSETRFLLMLLIIQIGLEGCHSMLHSSSSHRLFWQPFAAASISSFWKTHWQQDAASFLYSLAYAPAKKFVSRYVGKEAGKAAGVMAAFNLSGIWHAWAAAVLTTTPWKTAIGMWALFISHGVLCLVENAVWGNRQGGLGQRVLAWSFAVWSTGIWLRDAEKHTTLLWLKQFVE